MPVFNYRSTDAQGRAVRGTLLADSPRQARDLLRQRQLSIESIQEKGEGNGPWQVPVFLRSSFRYQVTSFYREMGTMLAVGVPLIESFDILITQLQGGFRSLILGIRESVAAGESLSSAFAAHPHVFDPFCVSMTEVGENAGTLERSFAQLAQFREQRDQMKDRVLSALLYPAIVATITLCVTIFLMTVVAPTLIQNLVEMERPLPWPTKVLKSISDFLLQYGVAMVIAAGLCFAGLLFWKSTESGNRILAQCWLRIPLIGKLVRKQNCGRISLFVGTLTESGLDPLRAFEIASKAISNPLYRTALKETSDGVRRGQDFATAFAKHSTLFPPTVVQIFTLGQNSGQLDSMLLRLATDLDRETTSLSGRIATLVEPLLIVCLGVIVGFVLLATMLPILEAGNVM